MYLLFVEKSIEILSHQGFTSFIIPNKFCNHNYAEILRNLILQNTKIKKIVDFSDFKIFPDATVKNIVYIFEKDKPDHNSILEIIKPFKECIAIKNVEGLHTNLNQNLYNKIPHKRFRLELSPEICKITNKIQNKSLKIEEICYVSFGLQPGDLKRFVFNQNINPERRDENPEVVKKFIRGRNIDRYIINYTGDLVFYLPKKLHRPAFPELFEFDKIVISRISKSLKADYDNSKYYCDKTTVEVIPYAVLSNLDPNVMKQRGIKLDDNKMQISQQYNLKYVIGTTKFDIIKLLF